ncbi:ATP-dependent DNA helicase sgs1 [Puccinia graminis f. sp. tritici]|uniref:DNA 3'-5' helicase n=1 Tax=Puccinia graminis f. sp. tritici TaxID=56615 RepID=A0A5B0PVH1_PUCGR|nr:ATP-dependent DNA helicase sgs1 [Puccinia graminis f. sp. tritici]
MATTRRFHAVTGDLDKEDIVKDFTSGNVAVISSTMALGLGQNWKQVRRVVHVGRGNPATIFQMIGRCGRGGNEGLALLYVEEKRRKGKNKIFDFTNVELQSDDDRMDALALTPVCFRLAFALDNMLGYIPLSWEDPNVIHEQKRQEYLGYVPCICSNCKPLTNIALANLIHINKSNFERYLHNPKDLPAIPNNSALVRPKKSNALTKLPPFDKDLSGFANFLVGEFAKFYDNHYSDHASDFTADKIFGIEQAQILVMSSKSNQPIELMETLIGGEVIDGQMLFLQGSILRYKMGAKYTHHLNKEKMVEEKKTVQANRLQLVKELKSFLRARSQRLNKEELERKRLIAAENKRKNAEKKEKEKAEKERIKEEDRIALAGFKAAAEERRLAKEAAQATLNSLGLGDLTINNPSTLNEPGTKRKRTCVRKTASKSARKSC